MPVLLDIDAGRGSPQCSGSAGQLAPDLCLGSQQWSDMKLLHMWMEERPTDSTLTRKGPIAAQAEFLEEQLPRPNLLDSTPLGYFELFWVLEDYLGRVL